VDKNISVNASNIGRFFCWCVCGLNIDFNIVNTNGVFVNVFTDVDSGGDFVIIDGAGVYIDGFFY
jgi:hypothetical protein